MEYLMGTDHCLFRSILIRSPWHNLDHFMILACRRSTTLEVTHTVLWSYNALPPATTNLGLNKGRHPFREATMGYSKSACAVCVEQCVYLQSHMEACQHTSICVQRSNMGSSITLSPELSDPVNLQGGLEATGRDVQIHYRVSS